MSSVDVPIVDGDVQAAPKDYSIPGAQEIAPLAVRAFIDGSGAGAPFRPALQLISPGGQVMWTAQASDDVAAGASADVSWFPRVGGGGAGGADPHAIHYDTNADSGGFVDSRTTVSGYSWADRTGTGWFVDSGQSGTPGIVANETNDGQVFDGAAIIVQRVSNRFEIQDSTLLRRFLIDHFGDMVLRMDAGSNADFTDHNGNDVFVIFEDGHVFTKLPGADPGVSGQLWNNGGVVNVSP